MTFFKSKTIKQKLQDFSFDMITFMKLLVKSTSVNIHNATRNKCGGINAVVEVFLQVEAKEEMLPCFSGTLTEEH